MSTNYEYEVPHPGVFIQEELDAREWAQRDLAYILNVDETALNKLIKGKGGISPDMAKALAKAFDVDEDFFANLQKAYDIAHAKEPDPAIETRARLQTKIPVREMIRRGWIENVNPRLMNAQLARFFRTANDNILAFNHAAKKTNAGEEATFAQLAWLYRVRQIGESIKCGPFSKNVLIDGLHRMKALMHEPEEIRHVPALLEECGVRLVLVEGLPGGKIDGVCLWLDAKSPVIGMSLRFDRIDNFWFVLRHECEHVLREHGRKDEVIDVEVDRTTAISEEEKQANDAAAEFCVPQEKMKSFIVRKAPLFSKRDVVAFSKMVGVHPGIVAGQLQKKTERWDLFRPLQVKIRHIITRTAMVDGWGHVAPV
ncbi:MAG TPA: HigA family addiction module antitoxin [Pseudolabrys sp.]|nr:HigA family addiction module antitoxin [Pseudolabrys sp.]